MRQRITIIIVALCAIAAVVMLWRGQQGTRDWSAAFVKDASRVFLEFGLVDGNLTRKTVEERKLGNTRYIHAYYEYTVPASFVWNSFEAGLKNALKRTRFSVTKTDQVLKRGMGVYTFTVSRGKFDIITVKVNRKWMRSTPPARKEKPAVLIPKKETAPKKEAAPKKEVTPKAVSPRTGPRVAIVIDDFGYNTNNLDTLFSIGEPVTLSILPNQRYSAEVARRATARGYEVILHLPLEAHGNSVNEEAGTIRCGMDDRQIKALLDKEIASVPGIDGVSNHMGSKATEDDKLMTSIMKDLGSRGLYFFDSLTSDKSVCAAVARSAGIKTARRDIFLDNSSRSDYIERQLTELQRMAVAHGSAIAICHDRKNTIAVLARKMPEMAGDGIRFVYLSEMVE